MKLEQSFQFICNASDLNGIYGSQNYLVLEQHFRPLISDPRFLQKNRVCRLIFDEISNFKSINIENIKAFIWFVTEETNEFFEKVYYTYFRDDTIFGKFKTMLRLFGLKTINQQPFVINFKNFDPVDNKIKIFWHFYTTDVFKPNVLINYINNEIQKFTKEF